MREFSNPSPACLPSLRDSILSFTYPGLTPWANVYRSSGAGLYQGPLSIELASGSPADSFGSNHLFGGYLFLFRFAVIARFEAAGLFVEASPLACAAMSNPAAIASGLPSPIPVI